MTVRGTAVAVLTALTVGLPSPAPAQALPTYGCHGANKPVSSIGTYNAAQAFVCWIDKVRKHELRGVPTMRLDKKLSRAARGILRAGHFGMGSVRRHVQVSGYVHSPRHGPRVRWRVARAAPVLLGSGVTPVLIGDDVLQHDARVFAPPFRDVGVAIIGNVFLAIAAVREG